MHWRSKRLIVGICLAATSLFKCGCPAVGYKKAADAAMSPLSPPALLRDDVLKLELRRAVVEREGFSDLGLSALVFMERGFLVGFVDSPEQGRAVLAAGRDVGGLRSLEGVLPLRPPESTTESDLELKGEVKGEIAVTPSLVSSRYTIEVLDGRVVLLGVVLSDAERVEVEQVARGGGGVKDVDNLLLVVEEPYAALRPHLR
jgi:osmotically-inducible protein OsmY